MGLVSFNDRMDRHPDTQEQAIEQASRSPLRLQRSLSSLETWGFGLSGLLLWLGPAPALHAALGPSALFVWIPAAIVGVLLNLQIKALGSYWQNISGGTPNYAARLLKNYPLLARYGALGYWLGWVSVPPMNATILSDLIQSNLEPLGVHCPEILLKVGFTTLPFIVAFTGTRALGILHLCFIIPAIGFLLAFCLQGMGWLAFSPASPGLFPRSWPHLGFGEWAKWFFVAVYAAYGCETASSFVADSRLPKATLKAVSFAAWLIVPVYVGGSWVLLRLATGPHLGESTFLNMLAASSPFWGQTASFLVTFLLAAGALLSSATAVCNSPRVLYQLAVDHHLSPVFAAVSRRGVLGPSLIFSLAASLICLFAGDVAHIVMLTGTGYLCAMMAVHLGLWVGRGRPQVLWPRLSLGFFLIETAVLIVGGLAWGWQDLVCGLLLPVVVLVADAAISRLPFALFHLRWWQVRYQSVSKSKIEDFVLVQVGVLLFLLCSAVAIGWFIRGQIQGIAWHVSVDLFVVLMMTIAFVGVAVACWTSLPQVMSIVEAREAAEHLFNIALDAILVLDEHGFICQANPAAESLFALNNNQLVGLAIKDFLTGLSASPLFWPQRCEQTLTNANGSHIVEVAISDRSNHLSCEYVVIFRDISQRKQAEADLRIALKRQEELAAKATEQAEQIRQTLQDLQQTQAQLIQTEKMSSLGQLVAGVAHEINNPVNFIYGNLSHVTNYTEDLLALISLYQKHFPETNSEMQNWMEEIDLEFMIEDLPKMLSSMKVGADRIRQIVLTLRNFSRIDESQMKPVNIHEGIESTLMILNSRFKAKPDFPAIQVVKNYGDLPLVECYAGQLNQVFMNILSNAIDAFKEVSNTCAMNRSTWVDISTVSSAFCVSPIITICTEVVNNDWVRISIRDNGPGMTEAVKSRLFDPFFTTKSVGQGTGLGLSISYQIVVHKHGGFLRCISQPGEGAEFEIEIPLRQRTAGEMKVS